MKVYIRVVLGGSFYNAKPLASVGQHVLRVEADAGSVRNANFDIIPTYIMYRTDYTLRSRRLVSGLPNSRSIDR